MMASARSRRGWRFFIVLNIGAALISAWFGYSQGPGTPLHSALVGVVTSLAIATPIILLETKGQRTLLRRLRRLPLLAYLGLKVVFYVVVILGGLFLVGYFMSDRQSFDNSFRASLAFSFAMAVGANLVLEIGRLLGFRTLKNLITARNVKPRTEQRAFLLIDMKNSTGMAEKLGPIRFHELLNDFFRDVSDAALECDAEIHKYVGDEAILTWPDDSATSDSECLSCPFLARELIAANADHYRNRFGVVPEFRAALHRGEIVAGEIGDVRHEIAYVGDTLNVAARLLEAAKELGHDILASRNLLDRTALPQGLRAESLPVLAVRNRAAPLEVAALFGNPV
jgi:adenylate cyclase